MVASCAQGLEGGECLKSDQLEVLFLGRATGQVLCRSAQNPYSLEIHAKLLFDFNATHSMLADNVKSKEGIQCPSQL